MKVLIIGLGSIAKKHIDVLYQYSNTVEIYALRSNKNSTEQYLKVKNIFVYKHI